MHKLHLTGWLPVTSKALAAASWEERGRLKAADRSWVAAHVRLASVPIAEGPRRVELVITHPRDQEPADAGSYWTILDALTCAGLLVDDSPKWCERGSVTFKPGRQEATTVLITDLYSPRPHRQPMRPGKARIRRCNSK